MQWVCDSREELSGPFPPSSPALARRQALASHIPSFPVTAKQKTLF